MKKLLATSAILIATTGFAYAQATTAPLVSAEGGVAASSGAAPDTAESTVGNEMASALVGDPVVSGTQRRAEAEVADNQVTFVFGNDDQGNDVADGGVDTDTEANAEITVQVGNNNSAVTMQDGTYNQAATLQIGDDNMAVVSQREGRHEAAIASVGNGNTAMALQDGYDHSMAIAQLGNDNTAMALQDGGSTDQTGNYGAHGQYGDGNTSISYQAGDLNTLASLQLGDDNQSYINQGGTLTALVDLVDGSTVGLTLANVPDGIASPTASYINSVVNQGSMNNSAASFQSGNANASAIFQYGNGNQAVNYQNTP
jgi:hypothetical protein